MKNILFVQKDQHDGSSAVRSNSSQCPDPHDWLKLRNERFFNKISFLLRLYILLKTNKYSGAFWELS